MNNKRSIGKNIKDFFTIPEDSRTEFWQTILNRNKISLWVCSIMIFGMELFNMARVLFLSKSGLQTLNNRIYFSMYCTLFLGALISQILQYLLQKKSVKIQWMVQYLSVLFFCLWHVCLNSYDLMRNSDSETYIFMTAVLALSIFILMPGIYSTICFSAAYILFMALAAPFLGSGEKVNLTITTIVALAISFTHCHSTAVEINQRRQIDEMNRQLQKLLEKDPLTNLLNKKAIQNCVEYHLELAGEANTLALLILDLDDFKSINDNYGHPCGDYVLEQISEKLRHVFSKAKGIGRIGGDEFMVVLTHAGDGKSLEKLGGELLQTLSEIRWKDKPLHIHCSVGICRVSKSGVPYDWLYGEADKCLYEAKQLGKNRCFIKDII